MTERDGHEQNILIVEDDDDLREAMSLFLRSAGYQVVEAQDGAAALERLRSSGSFCLILLDLFMPVMNGWDFRAAQLSEPSVAGVPVVVISADEGSPLAAAGLGAVDSMVKPIDFGHLLATVADHC